MQVNGGNNCMGEWERPLLDWLENIYSHNTLITSKNKLKKFEKANIFRCRLSAVEFNGSTVFLLVMQTWGKVCVTATSTTRVRTSCPSTWPRRCAAAPTTWEKPGTSRVRPVQLLLPVSVSKYAETYSEKTVKTLLCEYILLLSLSVCCSVCFSWVPVTLR